MSFMNTFARLLNLSTMPATAEDTAVAAKIAANKAAAKSKINAATYEISATVGLDLPFPVRKEKGIAGGYYNDTIRGSHGQGMMVAGMHLLETDPDYEAFFMGPVGKLPSWGGGKTTEGFAVPVDTYLILDQTDASAVEAMIKEVLRRKRAMEGAIGGKGLEAKRAFETDPSLVDTYVYGRVIADVRLRVGMIKAKVKQSNQVVVVDRPICELLVTKVHDAEVAHPRRYPLTDLEDMVIKAAATRSQRVLKAVEQGAEDAKTDVEAPKAAELEEETTGYA